MRVKATILYATETGRSHSYANIVNNVFGKVFATKVCMWGYRSVGIELLIINFGLDIVEMHC